MFLCILDVKGYPHVISELSDGFVENDVFSRFVLPTLEGERQLVQSEREPDSRDVVDTHRTSEHLKVAFKLHAKNPPLKFVYDLSKLDCDVSLYYLDLDKEHEFNLFKVTQLKLKPKLDFHFGVVSAYESSKIIEHSRFECSNSSMLKNLSSFEQMIVQDFLNAFNPISFY